MSADALTIERLTQSELFQRINEISSVVNGVGDAQELLDVSLRLTMNLFGAERGSIFVMSEQDDHLILKSACGMEIREKEAMVKKMGEGVVGRVAANKKPIVVGDIARDERFKDFKARASYKTSSFICAPLLIKDKLIGVINITDRVSGSRFHQDELQLMDLLATQIALNYRRIELYDKLKRIAKESADLKDELGKSSEEAHDLKKKVVIQEKLASIGKLAGGIAHEFNNPIDGVMRYTNLCLEQVPEDDVVHGYLVEIRHGLKRMASIVKNLLACSRNIEPSRERICVVDALEQSLQAAQNSLLSKNVVVVKDFCADPVFIKDLGVERIFTNLINNAVDAAGQDGQITLHCRCDAHQAVVEIEDNGCGIPEDKIQEIFEPFYTTKEIEKGCGLGLTIVSEIVKSYNGSIDIRTEKDKGTTFSITLPI